MKRISQLNVSVEASALSALNYKSGVYNPPISFTSFCKVGFDLSSTTTKKVLYDDLKVLYDAVVKDKKGRLMIVNNGGVSTIITDDFVISKSLENSLKKSNIFWHDLSKHEVSNLKDIIGYNSSITLIQ